MTSMKAKRIWFTNFPGIGNAVMVVPVLVALERQCPEVRYFHTENPVFRDGWFLERSGLRNLAGLSLAEWRRFNPCDWGAIMDFIRRNGIDVVVNLRNEGPLYDGGYYSFKSSCKDARFPLHFVDFGFLEGESRLHSRRLFLDVCDLLMPFGVAVSNECSWLASSGVTHNPNNVGFGLAGSQMNKRWAMEKWRQLAMLVLRKPQRRLVLFPGVADADVREASDLATQIAGSCKVVVRQPLSIVARDIGAMGCFVSHDTGLLHLATASGVPTIGIYTNTNPDIWAPPVVGQFVAFVNSNMFKCRDVKPLSGNCLHYYDACPALIEHPDTVDPALVASAVDAAIESLS